MNAGPAAESDRGLGGDFWKFWAGQTASNLGGSFTLFALPLLVYQLTGSALSLGLATALNFLPYLLFGLPLGAYADRVDRKRMMIATDVAQALVICAIPLASALGLLSVWLVYAAGFLRSTLRICSEAGQFAAVPSLVGGGGALVRANGLLQAGYRTASVLGPLAAGAAVAVAPIESVLLIDALSFLVSALALAAVRGGFNAADEGDPAGPGATLRQDILEGLRYVLGHPVLRNISLMMALINFVGVIVYSQLVTFAKENLGATDARVGLLYAAGAAGVVALSLLAGPLRGRLSFSKATLGALMLQGLSILALSTVGAYWLAVPVWALASGLGVFFNINTASLRQEIAPNRMLGRVSSVAAVIAWSAIPAGSLLGGAAVERTGDVAAVYGAVGMLTFAVALAFSFTALGRAERYLPAPATARGPKRAAARGEHAGGGSEKSPSGSD